MKFTLLLRSRNAGISGNKDALGVGITLLVMRLVLMDLWGSKAGAISHPGLLVVSCQSNACI